MTGDLFGQVLGQVGGGTSGGAGNLAGTLAAANPLMSGIGAAAGALTGLAADPSQTMTTNTDTTIRTDVGAQTVGDFAFGVPNAAGPMGTSQSLMIIAAIVVVGFLALRR